MGDDVKDQPTVEVDSNGNVLYVWVVHAITQSLYDNLKQYIKSKSLLKKLEMVCVPSKHPSFKCNWSEDIGVKGIGRLPVAAAKIVHEAAVHPSKISQEYLYFRPPTLHLSTVLSSNVHHYSHHKFTTFDKFFTPHHRNPKHNWDEYFIQHPYALLVVMIPPQLVDSIIRTSKQFHNTFYPPLHGSWSYKTFFSIVETFISGIIHGKSGFDFLLKCNESGLTAQDWTDLQKSLQFNEIPLENTVGDDLKQDWINIFKTLSTFYYSHMKTVITSYNYCLDEGCSKWKGCDEESTHGNPANSYNPEKPIKFGFELKQLHDVVTRFLLNFDLNSHDTWDTRAEEYEEEIEGYAKQSVTQVYDLLHPWLPAKGCPSHEKRTVTVDAGFGNMELPELAMEHDFEIIANIKTQHSGFPKLFDEKLKIGHNDYIILRTNSMKSPPSTTTTPPTPIFATITNIHKHSSLVHSFPSNHKNDYTVFTPQGNFGADGKEKWSESNVPSIAAFYMKTYFSNDIHNFYRSYSGTEALWHSHTFKVRVLTLLINYFYVNTYLAWYYLVTNSNKRPDPHTFLHRLEQDFSFAAIIKFVVVKNPLEDENSQ